jgi:hypothetical protein
LSSHVPPRPTIENLKKEAKRWLKALRANVAAARARLRRALPNAPAVPTLRDVQHALARERGFPGWAELRRRLPQEPSLLGRYERVAQALVTAYQSGEPGAMEIVWDYFDHRRSWDAMRRYVRLDLGRREETAGADDQISSADAQLLVARAQGMESWEALATFVASIPPGTTSVATKPVTLLSLGADGAHHAVGRARDWDEILAVLRAQRLDGLEANGAMTDEQLDRLSRLDHVTYLSLAGSQAITDEGLAVLARLARLRHLDLSGCPISDRGLEVLGRLPRLEWIALAGTRITDAGAAHLDACDRLRVVDLMGTQTGDGAMRALAGKPGLVHFKSGNALTDAGLALLHQVPAFRTWQGGQPAMGLCDFDAGPTYVLLRGPLTDAGLARLVGLDGLFALNLDSDRLAVTGAGLAPLVDLPHLGWLAFDARDDSMPYIAALPHLRFLMCQDTVAGDDGFVALSRSRTVEYVWGRRCYNLGNRGFQALAAMPALKALAVSCKNVDDQGLAALPRFAALRELMPMDVPDDGYRHVGRCEGLESLVLMYCRDTGDVATEHIARLPSLTRYFASYNLITDRTPEILSGMDTLESVAFSACSRLTNAGVARLARLPHLREVDVGGMPRVTQDVVGHFGPGVRVRYTP